MRTFTTLILVAAMAASLSACGRRGRPIPPEGAYTRTYPDIHFPDRAQQQQPQQQDQGTESTPQ